MSLKDRITDDMKTAMRAKDSLKLTTIRLLLAAIKQQEVDTRTTQSDEQILAMVDKMIKQRRDSLKQFTDAGRLELAEKEEAEIQILVDYLPPQLSDSDIESLIQEALKETSASSMQDMGKVMGILKPKLQGRADMGQVSAKVKSALA